MSAARVAVVTGGGRGIGASIAHRLAADGLAVMVSDIDPATAEGVAQEIADRGGQAAATALGAYLGKAKGETLAEYSLLAALGRTQTPEDVSSFVSYLAGRDSDFMTGQSVVVDGGIVMT